MGTLALAIALGSSLEVALLTMMYATKFGPCGPGTLLGSIAMTGAFRALRPAGNRSQHTLPRRPLIVMVASQSLTWIAGFWWALTKLAKARRS